MNREASVESVSATGDEHDWLAAQIERFTLRQGPYKTSEGITDTYLDAIAMVLAEPGFWRQYFEDRIARAGSGHELWPVAQGSGGAIVLGLLGRGTLWQPYKDHGIPWNNFGPLGDDSSAYHDEDGCLRVVLVDDCRFTGGALTRLRLAVEAFGCVVHGEVTAYPYLPLS